MRIRVATINLMAPAGPFLTWGDRAAGLARLLARHQPDLIGTQEATPEAVREFHSRFPGYGVLGRGRRADGSGIQCALFYRHSEFTVCKFEHFWLSREPERPGSKLPGMGSPRVATGVVLDTAAGPLSWLNVHFSHLSRRPQADIVLAKLAALPRPWLVTGDFNGTPLPPWSSYRKLTT